MVIGTCLLTTSKIMVVDTCLLITITYGCLKIITLSTFTTNSNPQLL